MQLGPEAGGPSTKGVNQAAPYRSGLDAWYLPVTVLFLPVPRFLTYVFFRALLLRARPLLSSVNVGEDCPVFDGLFEFCQLYTSGSIGA